MPEQYAVLAKDALAAGAHVAFRSTPLPFPGRIRRVVIKHDATSAGASTFDVNLDGASIFASPADRPAVAAGATETVVTDLSVAHAENAILSVDGDSIPLGGLSNISVVVVSDDLQAGKPAPIEFFVRAMYMGALSREPTSSELTSALAALETACFGFGFVGAARSLLDDIFTSAEFTALTLTDTEFVTRLYNAYLDRAPDAAGLANWVAAIPTSSRAAVRLAFAVSTEFTNRAPVFCRSQAPVADATSIVGYAITGTPSSTNTTPTFDAGASEIHWQPGRVTVREVDGSPAGAATVIEVPNGQLADMGGGVFRITPLQGATGATGSTGATGAAGAPGSVWYTGSTVPSSGTGADGDFYLRASGGAGNGDVYQKSSGAWAIVGNIQGPTGATGGGSSTPVFLADNFDDNSLDATLWTTIGTAGHTSETGQHLVISSVGSDDGIIFAGEQIFQSREARIHVVQLPTGINDCRPVGLRRDSDAWTPQVYYSITSTGHIFAVAIDTNNGALKNTDLGVYSLVTHAYLRIRENNGIFYWDYSADGAAWTNFTTWTNTQASHYDPAQMKAYVQSRASGSSLIVDDFSTSVYATPVALASAESVLGSTFAITAANGTYQDTGLSIVLPAASMYLIIVNVRWHLQANDSAGQINVRLYSTLDGAAIANSERTCFVLVGTSSQRQGTTAILKLYYASGVDTIKLQAVRDISGSWNASNILSDGSGRTSLAYAKLS